MIKLGTVGTSAICEKFLSGVELTNEFELCAVYSRSEKTGKSFAKKYNNPQVFTNLSQMASWDGIDAVYIASPNVCHAEQSCIFLENGKHVICEKPITTCAEEYIRLKKIADSKGLIYMEAIIPRHVKSYGMIKEALNKIGKISVARFDFCQRSSRMDDFLLGEKINIFDMSLHAGTLMDLGVYCVYGAIDFLGVPKAVTANAFYLSNGADGSGSAVLEYDNFPAILTYSKTAKGAIGSEIVGENGVLKIAFISQYAGVSLVIDGKEEAVVCYPTRAELMSGEAQRFADYILRFNQNAEDYESASQLCFEVHTCMDKIKTQAGIKYPV